MVRVVAVDHLDVHLGLGHPPGNPAELAGLALIEAEHDNVTFSQNSYASRLERAAGSGAILDEEVRDASAVHEEGASAFEADPGPPESLPHLGEGSRAVVERDRHVFHLLFDPGGAPERNHSTASGAVRKTSALTPTLSL